MTWRRGPAAPGARPTELAPISERMGWLLGLRVALAGAVVSSAALAPSAVGSPRTPLGPSAVYVGAALLSEAARRMRRRRSLGLVGASLLADGVFLAWATAATGGPESLLRGLIHVHLVGVTLCASYRAGIQVAGWHSLLAVAVPYAQAAGIVGLGAEGSSLLPGDDRFLAAVAVNVATMWIVTLVTALFASVNERELRRRRTDLEALAAMVAELDRRRAPEEIARILLTALRGTFGTTRGAVLASPRGAPVPLASVGVVGTSLPEAEDRAVASARRSRTPIAVHRPEPGRHPLLAALLPGARNVLVVPLSAEGTPIGVVVLEYPWPRIGRWTLSAIGQFASHAALALRNAWLLSEVEHLASTDPLTGVANRRTFQEALERELSRASRAGSSLGLVLLDVDRFKEFNDTHGHQAGDELLRAVARSLVAHCRDFDTVARYGGEEFVLILPDCDPPTCAAVADRVRRAAAQRPGGVTVTLSAGAASYPSDAGDASALVRAADEALYASKRAGRDRLTLAHDLRSAPAAR
ncbi:MAG TPA: sensor domain-containing diguanylate cyclase [Actinomycetota bacterium]|nr:sensor domain-containing diguanylate cyclase [Actinomycetota bacterium]